MSVVLAFVDVNAITSGERISVVAEALNVAVDFRSIRVRRTLENSSVRRGGIDARAVDPLPEVLALALGPAGEVDAFLAGLALGEPERAFVDVDADFAVFSESRDALARE